MSNTGIAKITNKGAETPERRALMEETYRALGREVPVVAADIVSLKVVRAMTVAIAKAPTTTEARRAEMERFNTRLTAEIKAGE
jgi:hypothetical protein